MNLLLKEAVSDRQRMMSLRTAHIIQLRVDSLFSVQVVLTAVGEKRIDDGAVEWFRYNLGRGPKKLHIYNPEYAHGFKWACCKMTGCVGGCIPRLHKAREEHQEKKTRIA